MPDRRVAKAYKIWLEALENMRAALTAGGRRSPASLGASLRGHRRHDVQRQRCAEKTQPQAREAEARGEESAQAQEGEHPPARPQELTITLPLLRSGSLPLPLKSGRGLFKL